jgi:hypothetical protein
MSEKTDKACADLAHAIRQGHWTPSGHGGISAKGEENIIAALKEFVKAIKSEEWV